MPTLNLTNLHYCLNADQRDPRNTGGTVREDDVSAVGSVEARSIREALMATMYPTVQTLPGFAQTVDQN